MLKISFPQKFPLKTLFLLAFAFFSSKGFCGPWFTGPLLAPSGHTIPAGHSNLELYGFYVNNKGIFMRNWKVIHTPQNKSMEVNPLFSHGFSSFLDVQLSVPYSQHNNMGRRGSSINDTSALLGLQLLEQKESLYRPDLRFTLQQVIPTGKFNNLNPLNNGTDAMGLGSYQTGVMLNFQHLLPIQLHYLRTRLSFNYMNANKVNLSGLNSYGGARDTLGRIRPGNLASVDLAGEFTLTQNWVPVMEVYAAHRQRTSFRGFRGTTSQGNLAIIGHLASSEITLAPALEYNFNEHFGIIGGAWFTVYGTETTDFLSYVLAFNAYW